MGYHLLAMLDAYAVIGYLVGWHGVGHAGLTGHTAPAAPSALCIHGTITLYPKHGAAGNWLAQSGELSAELPKAWLQHTQLILVP